MYLTFYLFFNLITDSLQWERIIRFLSSKTINAIEKLNLCIGLMRIFHRVLNLEAFRKGHGRKSLQDFVCNSKVHIQRTKNHYNKERHEQ
jgi:hypothetical protein